LLDRIDLHVEAPSLPLTEMQNSTPGETSAAVRERIIAARVRQAKRFTDAKMRLTSCNARMSHSEIRAHCAIDKAYAELLHQAMEQLSLSARAYPRPLLPPRARLRRVGPVFPQIVLHSSVASELEIITRIGRNHGKPIRLLANLRLIAG
jgi:predicted ATPase with chaperone activity